MKKISALLLTFILTLLFTLSFFPATAFAADATIDVGGTYDLASYGNDSAIIISTTDPVTLIQSNATTALRNFRIACSVAAADLTINGININNSTNRGRCALAFTGAGNTLTLAGSSKLKSGDTEPGIRVETGTGLTIGGTGSVEATGGHFSAGIGGGTGSSGAGSGGTITILSGTVIANGGDDSGAGIGGGGFPDGGSGGKITISGGTVIAQGGQCGDAGTGGGAGIGGGYIGSAGTIFIYGDAQVTATGGEYAAGIGSGYAGSGGNITIIGSAQVTATGSAGGAGIGGSLANHGCTVHISDAAQVTATGSDGGAGIGGGGGSGYIHGYSFGGDGGDFNISGGIVTATGTGYGAGIGGGGCYNIASDLSGGAGNITLKGGTVYARHGELGGMDIGAGEGRTSGTLSLSDTGLAFLYNDSYLSNIITSYTHLPNVPLDSKNRMYGYPVSAGWESSSVLCYEPLTIAYNANSSETYGTPPETQTVLNTLQSSFTASENTLSHTYLDFVKWNINAGGTGTDCHPGLDYYTNTSLTLYAIWSIRAQSITVSESSISVTESGTYQLDATLSPDDSTDSVYWSTDDPTVAGVNQNGTVYGISVGTCTITATAGGKSDTCAVTVTGRPSTSVTRVSLSRGKKTLYIGDVFVLTAIVIPDDAPDKSVTWKTSDSGVATVTNAGLVTAKGVGVCTITATAGGQSDSCSVSVSLAPTHTPAPPIGVSSVHMMLETDFTAVLYVGDTLNLSAAVIPSNADNQSLEWKSSDESVLTVSSYGLVKALSEGEATVTVTAGGVSDSYSITVKAAGDIPSPTSADASPSPLPSVGDVMLNFAINTENLPYGAEYILLPDGEVMPLSDESTMTVCVNQCYLNDGVLQITALDAKQNPLGAVNLNASTSERSALAIIVFVIFALIVGAGGALLFVRLIINKKN